MRAQTAAISVLAIFFAACSQVSVSQPTPPQYVRVTYDIRGILEAAPGPRPAPSEELRISGIIRAITNFTGYSPDGRTTWRYTSNLGPSSGLGSSTSINNSAAGDGSIVALSDAITVRQTPEVQAQIATLLKTMRDNQDLQVSIETRFLVVDKDFLTKFQPDLAFRPDQVKSISVGRTQLDDFQTNMLIRESQVSQKTISMSAPRATMFAGQNAHVGVTTDLDPFGDQAPPTATTPTVTTQPVALGLTIDVQPIVTADRHNVRLSFANSVTERVIDATVPEGQALLIRAGSLNDPSFGSAMRPITENDGRIVLILVKPEILQPRQSVDAAPNTLVPIRSKNKISQ